MRKRSIWVLLGLLIAALTFALVGCGGDEGEEKTEYQLSETAITLTVGETKELTVSPAPTGTVTWASGDTAIATVSAGTVTAVSAGSTTVTATIEGVETPLTCAVTVNAGGVSSKTYALNYTSLALKTGETKQLSVTDEEEQAVTAGVSYASGNTAVATVSQSGLVEAVGAGSTTITATVEGQQLTCSVTVAQKYTYTLTPGSLDIAAGASAALTLNVTPELPEGTRPHTFTSSNPSVAIVDGGSGLVTGVAKGTAVITCATEDGQEVTADVTVTEYTVTIGGEAFAETLTMRAGTADKEIAITADPSTHPVDATITSANQSAVTIVDGTKIHAVAAGVSAVSITVGGRTFTTNVTVTPAVQYTLQADGEPIEEGGSLTVKLGETATLSVERDPAPTQALTVRYASEAADVASFAEDTVGTVTANKVGSAEITVTVTDPEATSQEPIVFHVTVNVVIESSLTGTDIDRWTGSYNLQYLDENKTIDWDKYAADGQTGKARMANNTDLISNYDMQGHTDEAFWDYKAPIFFEDAAEGGGVNTYGRAVHGSFSIQVKLTNAVSKVIVFTGAWKASGTVKFMLGDAVLQSSELVGSDPAVARMYTLAVTTDGIQGELALTILFDCTNLNGGNFSIAAVAVIGKVAQGINYTAEATGEVTRELSGAQNITEAGNLDWVAANGTRKAGVPENTVIKTITYAPNENGGDNNFGDDEGKGAYITWTDGTAAAPATYKNFKWAADSVTIPVALTKGNFTVSLYVTGWNCGYLVAVYDKDGHFLNAYQGADEWKDNSHTAKIAITLDVKEAGDYTFKLTKCRGTGNHGWAAIAVSQNSEYSLEKNVFDLTVGGTAPGKVVVMKGGEEYTTDVSFKSSDSQVVTVDSSDGSITVVGHGTAVITATVGDEEFLAFVTVTEYTLTSEANITLSVDSTSAIKIAAEPNRTFTASYQVTEGDTFVDVNDEGLITAKAAGSAVVTATVDGKTFTINVTVVSYKLDQETITLTLGGDSATATLKMVQGEDTPVEGVEFTSEDEKIASVVKETGVITAQGFGQTTIKAKKDSTTLECTVIVKLTVTPSSVYYADGSNKTINLDEIDESNVTLDWHFFRNDTIHKMAGGDLIGNLDKARSSGFGDYRAHITWYNGDAAEKASVFGYTDGITFNGGGDNSTFSFPVKVTKDVSKIVIFTGAWQAKNTIILSYEGVEYARYEFKNAGNGENDNKNMQIVFTPDMENFGTEEKTFTVTMSCGENDNGEKQNISLVAIAVIGSTPRGAYTPATASQTHELTSDGEAVDLTAVGTLDWAYIWDDNHGLVTKDIKDHIIGPVNCIGNQGQGYDHFEKQSFKWSDGTYTPLGGETTDYFKWCDNVQAICVTLKQSAKVTLWISAYKGSIDLTVYDRGTEILTKTRVIEGNDSTSQGVKVEVTLTVTEESTFTFLMKKEGGGNFGLGAIAVANAE